MSRTSLPYLKKFDGMQPAEPTPIEDFGFDVFVGEKEATFVPHGKVPLSMRRKTRKCRKRFSRKNLLSFP